MGSVINEYKDIGRGDFLVRNVMGLDQRVGGVIAGEMCIIGQTVQFHVRDAATAAEDLQLLLDSQVLQSGSTVRRAVVFTAMAAASGSSASRITI